MRLYYNWLINYTHNIGYKCSSHLGRTKTNKKMNKNQLTIVLSIIMLLGYFTYAHFSIGGGIAIWLTAIFVAAYNRKKYGI